MALVDLAAPALAFFIAAASPGLAALAVAGAAMASGRRAGLALALGLSLGLAIWGAVTALGLGAFVLGSPPALFTLRIGAAAYLLYLAWRAAQSALRGDVDAPMADAASGDRLVWRGLLLNLSNPKAALAWAAVIAIGLPDGARAGDLAVVASVCAAMGCAIYAAYALGFALAPTRRGYRRLRRWVEGAFAAPFRQAGLRLALGRVEAA